MPNQPPAPGRSRDLPVVLGHMLGGVSVVTMAIYLGLSLGSAVAGGLAAVWLVPLVQPGHALVLAGHTFEVQGSVAGKVAAFAAVTALFALLRWQAARVGARLAGRYGMGLRREVHARLVEAPLVSLADATSAEIANVLTHNAELITQGFNALLQLLVAAVTAVVSLALALWISPPLVLAMPLFAVLAMIASRVSSREQEQVSRQYIKDMTQLFWLSEDFPQRLRHVRSFGKEQAEKARYGSVSTRIAQGYQRHLELIASGRLVLELLAAAGLALIFLLAYRAHGADQAALIAVCLLLGRLLPYLVLTRQSFHQLRAAVPAFELWQRYTRLDAGEVPAAPAHAWHAGGVVHIEQVRLAPPLSALEIGDFALLPGALTLICGDSGIGKSSLIDVLAGMVPPAAFVARIGERSFGFDDYRQWVRHGAYVSQSVRPWQRSIRECLSWAAPDATDDMMRRALADVGLDRRLAMSSEGLDTAVSDSSSRLSGGELQRLLLAQVILRQPVIALLDEATSALDEISELAVLAAVRRRLPHTILVVVSHRSSVEAIADRSLIIGKDAGRATASRKVAASGP